MHKKLKFWVISDTHTHHEDLSIPDDIDGVIHAGDGSAIQDTKLNEMEMFDFLEWFDSLNVKYKIFIPGNHDTSVERGLWDIKTIKEKFPSIIVLIDETVIIEGIKIFGSPYTPSFGHGWAFNCSRSSIDKHWSRIEEGTDIVVTHGPAKGMLDLTRTGDKVGCATLLFRVGQIKPKYCICGHIHEEGGKQLVDQGYPGTTFINAAVVNLYHIVKNNGHIIEI